MRPVPRLLLALALAALPVTAGCVQLMEGPDPNRVVTGRVDDTAPTNTYLKVHLVNESGYRALANFDRRDWYVRGLEQELAAGGVDHATVQGQDRDLLNEVIARTVLAPDSLNAYRFDEMERQARAEGRPFDKAALDAEWDERLRELGLLDPIPLPAGPTALEATSTLP